MIIRTIPVREAYPWPCTPSAGRFTVCFISSQPCVVGVMIIPTLQIKN